MTTTTTIRSDSAKVYDANGVLEQSGVTVVIAADWVCVGAGTYPRHDLTIDVDKRTIASPNGWEVEY